jgi:surface polysaccharide O-acyltransferase-like enzyme
MFFFNFTEYQTKIMVTIQKNNKNKNIAILILNMIKVNPVHVKSVTTQLRNKYNKDINLSKEFNEVQYILYNFVGAFSVQLSAN